MADMTENDGKLLCAFPERLDNAACSDFGKELMDKAAASSLPVVFDIGNVEFVSSSFLRLVIQVAKKVGRENLSLTGLSENVREVFVISGLDEMLALS